MHSILRQQAAQFVAVGGCGCLILLCISCTTLCRMRQAKRSSMLASDIRVALNRLKL